MLRTSLLFGGLAVVGLTLLAGCSAEKPAEPPVAKATEHDGGTMPASLSAAEEKTLYLTPKGKYTEKDIAANGGVTASQKYRSFRARHDHKPKLGDLICPVTMTKANPACTWVVDGQKYEFCCPPCIDEFVGMAREQPELLRRPQDYVKK